MHGHYKEVEFSFRRGLPKEKEWGGSQGKGVGKFPRKRSGEAPKEKERGGSQGKGAGRFPRKRSGETENFVRPCVSPYTVEKSNLFLSIPFPREASRILQKTSYMVCIRMK